jgi:hypothetical protein
MKIVSNNDYNDDNNTHNNNSKNDDNNIRTINLVIIWIFLDLQHYYVENKQNEYFMCSIDMN